jgi:N,N'-diacetyllegionaminate synthase
MVKLIAELSMNFVGDMTLAKEMIFAAKESGADYVKVQTWQVKNLKPGPWDNDGRRDLYKKAELTQEKYYELITCCNKVGIKFLTSCFNINDLDFIRLVSDEVKIPSPECSNKELVLKALKNFKTVYISTGASLEEEFRLYGQHNNAYLLHCVSTYPCPAEKVNILRMNHLKKFTSNVGYSGHLFGIEDAIAAISLGAKVVEKHFTTSRDLEFRDNKFSILPEEMKKIREYANVFEKMEINNGVNFQECERVVREQYARRWSGN